ncbi:deoxyuridine 5`-triphosphate nucleotidohydrolase [Caballeronia sordidicola]|uniref:Deoxyuridine 5`-triphosphate nucleotidohydrolase n=1 Tax=Caballeronia sordidicola TaxID=196367 RepID=A0A158H7U5_CABSO|nr:diguanylate cyclase [Caballeronia sordidicola]SAL40171.1 deoxyuridine 5`-triphosphate nucleotidohydrolase [Caballeronia sordidicola]
MLRPGLTFRLSVLLACIGVLASGATGYYAYRANRTMLVKEAEHSLMTSTELLAQRSSVAIEDIAADAQVLASLPSSAAIAQADDGAGRNAARERLAQVFFSFMAHHREYLQVRLIARGHHGLELIRFDRDANRAVRVEDSGLQEKGQFAYVFDTLALGVGHIYVSPITVNHERGAHAAEGRPTLRLGTPVANDHGVMVGVVVIDVDLAKLLERLQVDLPGNYEVYLANEWGDFLVHPDASQTFGFDKGRRIFMQERFPATRPLFEAGRSAVVLNGLAQPVQASARILAFIHRPFGESEGNRFVVLGLSRPLSDALNGASMLGNSIVRMVLISSLLAIVLAVMFARALVQPLQTLAHAATHFFADHTMQALPVRRTDEIGVLARCFERMRGEIRSHIDGLHSRQHELAHLARHDVLTGLPNRMLFMERLEEAIRDAAASAAPLAVLFVDLDRFKQINDQYGHSAGDDVLVEVARRLQGLLSSADMVARLGGDEFVVLINGTRSAGPAPEIASRIKETLDDVLLVNERRMTVGASIGISQFPGDGISAGALLLNADAAMYAAKSDGKCAYLRYQDLPEAQRSRKTAGLAGEFDTDDLAAAADDAGAML